MSLARLSVVIFIGTLLIVPFYPAVNAVDPSYLDLYLSYDQVTDELYLLAEEYGDVMSIVSIGRTYEDRDIWAVKVSDNPYEHEEEPEVLFTGAHHAKEWPSVEVVISTLRLLLESYGRTASDLDGDGFADSDNDLDGSVDEDPFDGEDNDGDGAVDEDWSDARLSWMVDNRQTWFIPVLNPDGLEHCRQQVSGGETDEANLWRKNREPNYQDLGALQGLTYGVDLNRNYGFHWGELGAQSYANSAAGDYIGPVDKRDDDGDRRVNEDPMDNLDNDGDGLVDEDTRGGFSTIENAAIRDFVAEHIFVLALHFHTFKGTIYWPWMYTLQLPEDEGTFKDLAEGMNRFNGYEYRNMSDRNQQLLSRHPPVDGDSNDWMYGKHGILSYTIELGYNCFIPPEEELRGIVAENLGANLFVMEVADNPRRDRLALHHDPLEDVSSDGGVEVTVRVSGGELKAGGLRLCYRVGDGNFEEVTMEAATGAGGYRADVPGAGPGDEVTYYFVAASSGKGTTFLPAYAPYEVFTYEVPGGGDGTGTTLVQGVVALIILGTMALVYARKKASRTRAGASEVL